MSELTLSIKQKFFDQIKAGTKKIETREIRPSNTEKYCVVTPEGEFVEPRKYDTIKFLTGEYKEVRPSMVVKVENAEVFFLTDEKTGEYLTFEENGEEYISAEVEYTLGEIVSS